MHAFPVMLAFVEQKKMLTYLLVCTLLTCLNYWLVTTCTDRGQFEVSGVERKAIRASCV